MSQAIGVPLSCHHLANSQSTTNGRRACYSSDRDRRVILKGRISSKMSTQSTNYDNNSSRRSRHLANLEASVWGEHFLSYTPQRTKITTQERHELEELKEKVRKMLIETPDNSTQKLVLIDTIQRLGVAYHFDNEIEASLQNIFDAYCRRNSYENNNDNLYVVALRVRLVRQQGHYLSSDVFKKFRKHDRTFTEAFTNDVQGLLSLYEAANLRVHEEEILEEALTFTTTRLESMLPYLSSSLRVQVTEALNQPIRRTMRRLGARKYIGIYETIETHDDLLLKFAKVDFNILQKLHQQEISNLTRWWQDLNLANKLPYGKDRLVESYLWIMGTYSEPQYSVVRQVLTKITTLLIINDDTFDVHATFDELVIYNNAFQRWDIDARDSLPTYLRPLYQAILEFYDEMEQILTKEGKSDRGYYAKNEIKKIVASCFKEAEWSKDGYNIPKYEEYIANATVTVGTPLIVMLSCLLAVEELTKETLEWMTNEPLILRASSEITRLMDDASDHQSEHQEGHKIASTVECYMKEYQVSAREAYIGIQKIVTNAWKDINKELLLLHNKVPPMYVLAALYLAQVTYTFYGDGQDGYTNSNSTTKDAITLLAIEPVKY